MNSNLVEKLRDLARLRQIEGANRFRSAAYSNAADLIESLDTEIEDATQLYAVDGIGDKLVIAVGLILERGTHPELVEHEAMLDAIRELTRVPGVGPKRALEYLHRGIRGISALKEFASDNQKLLDAIAFAEISDGGRIPRKFLTESVEKIVEELRPRSMMIEVTGSWRRGLETVKDIDILVCPTDREIVLEKFLELGLRIEAGPRKASIFATFPFKQEVRQFRVDLMIVDRECWGAALCHFTGSREHNVRLRELAKSRGITVSQNGIIGPQGEFLGGEYEYDLYNILGIPYVDPTERDD